MSRAKNVDVLNGKLLKSIISFSIPLLFVYLIQNLFNWQIYMTRKKVIFQKLPSGILFINLAKIHGDWKEVNFREQPLRKKTSGHE